MNSGQEYSNVNLKAVIATEPNPWMHVANVPLVVPVSCYKQSSAIQYLDMPIVYDMLRIA